MELKEMLVSSMLVGLVMICIFSFIFAFTGENTDIENLDTTGLDLDALETNLNSQKELAEAHQETLSNDNPLTAFGELILLSIVGIGTLVGSTISILVNLIFGGITTTLGIPALVSGIVISIIILGIVFGTWKLIKQGA